MRSGTELHAAGHSIPGTSPTSAPPFPLLSSRFDIPKLPFLPRNLTGRTIDRSFSNRHTMRLEVAPSPAKSTRSLFLIVTKQHNFSHTHFTSSQALVAQACPPACPDAGTAVRFAS